MRRPHHTLCPSHHFSQRTGWPGHQECLQVATVHRGKNALPTPSHLQTRAAPRASARHPGTYIIPCYTANQMYSTYTVFVWRYCTFETGYRGCFVLSYRGNLGANGVSYTGGGHQELHCYTHSSCDDAHYGYIYFCIQCTVRIFTWRTPIGRSRWQRTVQINAVHSST